MSQLGELLQRGMLAGMDRRRADQELALRQAAMEDEAAQRALRSEIMREQQAAARREAEMMLTQQEADRSILGAMFAPASAAPGDGGKPADWWSGLTGETLASASPRVQELASRAKMGRDAEAARRAQLQAVADRLRAQGMTRFLGEREAREMIGMGIGLRPDELPRSMREELEDRDEKVRRAKITLMTTNDFGEQDSRVAGLMMTMPGELVDIEYERWKQARAQEMQTAALQRLDPGLDPEQAAAMAQLGAGDNYAGEVARRRAGEPTPEALDVAKRAYKALLSDGTTTEQRADAYAQLAGRNMPMAVRENTVSPDGASLRFAAQQAEQEYLALTGDGSKPGVLTPPTEKEMTLAAITREADLDPPGLGNRVGSESEWNKARAKVAAWRKYESAVRRANGEPQGAMSGVGGAEGGAVSDDAILAAFRARHGRMPSRANQGDAQSLLLIETELRRGAAPTR